MGIKCERFLLFLNSFCTNSKNCMFTIFNSPLLISTALESKRIPKNHSMCKMPLWLSYPSNVRKRRSVYDVQVIHWSVCVVLCMHNSLTIGVDMSMNNVRLSLYVLPTISTGRTVTLYLSPSLTDSS